MIPFDETKHPASKRVGVASEATIITRIKIGRIEREYRTYRKRLEDVLEDVQVRESQRLPTPVSLLRQIHFARWVILDRPGSAGDLLFTSNFDGDMKHYFRSFSLQLTRDINAVWENCEDYPGAEDFDRLWQYVKEHQKTTRTFYNAYPTLSMPEIERIDALKKAVTQLDPAQGVVSGALLKNAQLKKPPVVPHGPPKAAGAKARPVDQADIQANVLDSAPWKRVDYRFLTIDDPQPCRQGLLNLRKAAAAIGFITADRFAQSRVEFRESKGSKGLTRSMNLAFTWSGLKQLGLAAEYLGGMPLAFQQGMAARAEILGDVEDWAPNQWQGMLGHPDIHILVVMSSAADDSDDYWRDIVARVQGAAKAGDSSEFAGCRTVHRERGQRLEQNGDLYEPFGFRDGIGQPFVEGVDKPGSRWGVPIAPGEFILGYPDIDGNDQIAERTVGAPFREFCFNGTYMVFRKIEQDVAAFEEATGSSDRAGRLFGRREDGGSLAIATPRPDLDDFDYSADPNGSKCPFGSHVRRINPRNEESRRHRILRRGIPYKDDDKTVGMMFVCFNARIDSQFEFLQSEWCGKGDFLGSFTDARDPVVGGGSLFFDPDPVKLKSFVTVRGGEYFFLPGMAALDSIASGKFDTLPDPDAKATDTPAAPIDPTRLDELMFDPVDYINAKLAASLLTHRSIERKPVAWESGRRQSVYYVACLDHVRQILADDVAFPSDQYARKIERLIDSYDFPTWLRPGETAPDLGPIKKVMLGMTHEDPEKKERLRMLNDALKASSIDELRARIGSGVESTAAPIMSKVISANPLGFDIAKSVAYALPLQFAVDCLGFPALTGFSEAYQALYFERDSIDDARAVGFLDLFPRGADAAKLPRELFGLVHPIAIYLLIDQYDTESALKFARLAVRELLDRLAEEVFAEEDRFAKGITRPTLLSQLLQHRPAGMDPATFRLRVGMIIVELVVGGVDTTAKGIANVVDCLLSHPPALKAAQDAVDAHNDPKLNNLILEALRLSPVAPLIVRECPYERILQLSSGQFLFEPGSRIFLIMEAAMKDPAGAPPGVDLRSFVLDDATPVMAALDPIRRLAFGDGAHGCLGTETVLAEIRAVLKPLLARRNFRRAAGPAGRKQERFSLPVSLELRFDP